MSVLLFAWALILAGLLVPVLHVPIPNPDLALLLFVGPSDALKGGDEMSTHAAIDGARMIVFVIVLMLKKFNFSLPWLGVALMSSPLILGWFAPAFYFLHSCRVNALLATVFMLGWVVPSVYLLLSGKNILIDTGYYCWVIAWCVISASCFLSCRLGKGNE